MAAPIIPPPTAELVVLHAQVVTAGPVGVDLVCMPEDGMARILVPIPGHLQAFRLDLTRDQLAALLDELVDLADALDVQRDTLTAPLSYGGVLTMDAPSTWVVDRTGDLLYLDGTLSAVDVRAEMVKACNGQADITALMKAGALMWCIKGRGFELHSISSVDRALRIAALSSEWREQRA